MAQVHENSYAKPVYGCTENTSVRAHASFPFFPSLARSTGLFSIVSRYAKRALISSMKNYLFTYSSRTDYQLLLRVAPE